jgi:Tfp pilus assembly protein PilZ
MAGTTRERSSSSPELPARLPPEGPWRLRIDSEEPEIFVYVDLKNVARVGLFVPSREPRSAGTRAEISLLLPGGGLLPLRGAVQWINPWRHGGDNINPGAGVSLEGLDRDLRERLVMAVRTLVFLR